MLTLGGPVLDKVVLIWRFSADAHMVNITKGSNFEECTMCECVYGPVFAALDELVAMLKA